LTFFRRKSLPAALLRWGAWLGLSVAAYWTARLAYADQLSRAESLSARVRAVRLAPLATYYERLAEKRAESGGDPLPDLQQAAARDPHNPERFLQLGLRAEWNGDFALAEGSLLRAAGLSRLYQPKYSLAQYYFRRGNADLFFRWTRAAFETASGDVTPLLDLCWRLRPDGQWLAREALSLRPEIAQQHLLFLVRHQQTGVTGPLARHLAETARSEDLPVLLEYCNECLASGVGGTAADVWSTLCRRQLLPYQPLDAARGVSLTNGDFRIRPSGSGFDWRLASEPWLHAAESAGGWRLVLSGKQPESARIALQYVPVVRGRRYRLRSSPCSNDAPCGQGLHWLVYDRPGEVADIGRDTDDGLWFTPASDLVQLALIYQRAPGTVRLEGSMALSRVQLEMLP